jgi:hypothetical protein
MRKAARKPAKAAPARTAKPSSAGEVLSLRALNRALLARQMLIERQKMSAMDALTHLIGMQAQAPFPPYFGLWTRLVDFRPEALSELIKNRKAVRLSLMRSTIHLVTAKDAIELRPILQSVQDRGFYVGSRHGPALEGLDMKAILKLSRRLVEEKPLTFTGIGKLLEKHFPGRPVDSLGYAARTHFAMIQVPPRGIWGKSGQPAHTTIEKWLGRSVGKDMSPDTMILRYIAAFGPASVRDAQAWSGLTKLTDVFDRLRPRLVTFRDEKGRELFDLPDAPRPDADMKVPVRFLPEYDNVLLSHAVRTRIVSEDDRKYLFGGGGVLTSTILVDGFVHGSWKILRKGKAGTLEIKPYRPLAKRDIAALTAEGKRLLAFAAPDVKHEVRFADPK